MAWESEKASLAAELAAQRHRSHARLQRFLLGAGMVLRAASEAMEKTLAEERRCGGSLPDFCQRLACPRLTTNQMPECDTNAENAGSPNGQFPSMQSYKVP